jgi:hypothetical protein
VVGATQRVSPPQSQLSLSQKTTLILGDGPNSQEYLDPTILNPLNNLSLQPQHSTNPPLEPFSLSNQHLSALNEAFAKQATPIGSDHPATKDTAPPQHLTPQLTSFEICSLTTPTSSLFPGSISIELNQFNHGPSCASNKKNQGKKPYTSPSNAILSTTEKTNSLAKNFQP